jgi:copper chaperone CopZ
VPVVRVERALAAVPGVRAARVDLATGRASVAAPVALVAAGRSRRGARLRRRTKDCARASRA